VSGVRSGLCLSQEDYSCIPRGLVGVASPRKASSLRMGRGLAPAYPRRGLSSHEQLWDGGSLVFLGFHLSDPCSSAPHFCNRDPCPGLRMPLSPASSPAPGAEHFPGPFPRLWLQHSGASSRHLHFRRALQRGIHGYTCISILSSHFWSCL